MSYYLHTDILFKLRFVTLEKAELSAVFIVVNVLQGSIIICILQVDILTD